MSSKNTQKVPEGPPKKWTLKEKGKRGKTLYVKSQNSFFYTGRAEGSLVQEPESLNYSEVEPMLDFLEYNQRDAAIFLEVDPGTISRWKRNKNDIGKLRTMNLMNVDEIIAKGVRIFGSEQLFKNWLQASNDALGSVKPVELLKDPYGVTQVEEAIDALSWGNYL